MCCILCVCIYVITLYCIYGMFLIDYGTPVLFKSLFLKLFIKALLSRLLDTSAIEIHYYYYYYYYYCQLVGYFTQIDKINSLNHLCNTYTHIMFFSCLHWKIYYKEQMGDIRYIYLHEKRKIKDAYLKKSEEEE